MGTATARSRNSCLWIGDPESNRAAGFRAARSALGLPPAEEICFGTLPNPARSWDEVRLDSPGKSLALERKVIEWSEGPPLTEPLEKGRILAPARWYSGLKAYLRSLPQDLPYHNHPSEIEVLFDKRKCHARLADRGLPVIPSLDAIQSTADLRARLKCNRAFVKLFCGSSCSGALAYTAEPEAIFAPLERSAPGVYYNSRKIRRYRGPIAREIIDWFCAQGVHVEKWLPKDLCGETPFDLRVVTIAGQPCHRVVRQGNSPMLGLQLGARRGCVEDVSAEVWHRVEEVCRGVAAGFPLCHVLGIDLLTVQGHPRIIEVNAFGDLIPGISWNQMDTYTAELQAW